MAAKTAKTADAITAKKNEADKKLRVAQKSVQLAKASLTTATVPHTLFADSFFDFTFEGVEGSDSLADERPYFSAKGPKLPP